MRRTESSHCGGTDSESARRSESATSGPQNVAGKLRVINRIPGLSGRAEIERRRRPAPEPEALAELSARNGSEDFAQGL